MSTVADRFLKTSVLGIPGFLTKKKVFLGKKQRFVTIERVALIMKQVSQTIKDTTLIKTGSVYSKWPLCLIIPEAMVITQGSEKVTSAGILQRKGGNKQ